ncbi:MAG: MFS transporter [Alphaproteobacteria bacterium]|nr:MFS transporter [Alphaproteobacteria bacterium]
MVQGAAGARARLSWAFFDWANQPFFTVITTFIYAPFFAAVVVGDTVKGQALWGYTQAAAGLAIALLSPILGAAADVSGRRKPWILTFQALTVLGCLMLWWVRPGDAFAVTLAMLAIVIATIGAEFSIVFNNALLPGLVSPARMGRLSGLGWGMGYAGGLVALLLVLLASRPELFGIVTPAGQVLFGVERTEHIAERATGPGSALWLVVFVLPMFLFVPEAGRRELSLGTAIAAGLGRLLGTLRRLGDYRRQLRFLIAFMLYNDGLAAVIAFGGIYAAGSFGWGTTELGLFGIVLTVIAMAGAFAGGWLDDRLGSKRAVLLAILLVGLATLGIMSLDARHALFLLELPPPVPGGGLFASTQEKFFLGFALLLGLGMGPMQAASRTLIGRLAPPDMVGEFYGLFALSGKATTFLAPFLIALITQATGSQRPGLVVVLVFLGLGLVLLVPLREPNHP